MVPIVLEAKGRVEWKPSADVEKLPQELEVCLHSSQYILVFVEEQTLFILQDPVKTVAKKATNSWVIPCEKSEKNITDFFLDFWLEKSKVLVILVTKIPFLISFGEIWPFFWFFKEISNFVKLDVDDNFFYFSPTQPSGPSWSGSRIVCLCVPFSCDFFLGLSLVLRSHDQIPASHWSTLLPYHCPLPMQFFAWSDWCRACLVRGLVGSRSRSRVEP